MVRHRLWVMCLAAVVFGGGLLGAGEARAQPDEARSEQKQSVRALLDKGEGLFYEQLYEESIQVLSAALMRPGIAKAERIEVYRLLAYNYIVLRREVEADGAVRGLLVLNESYRLPESESPRFRDFFKKTREAWEAEGKPGLVPKDVPPDKPPTTSPVAIKHASPAQVEADLPILLEGTVDDPDAVVAKLTLYFRAGASGSFTSVEVEYATRRFKVEIPAAAVQPPLIEYYLEATDEEGLARASRGDAEAPLRIAVPEGGSVLTSPWFWVPTGLAVVGAAVAIAVVVATGGDSESATSTVTVNVFE